MNTVEICPNCFQKDCYHDNKCEKCGYEGKTEQPSFVLPAGYKLNKRYLIGRVLRYDEVLITYLAQDLTTETKVEIREYFPRELVERNGDAKPKLLQKSFKQTYHQGIDVFENEGKIIRSLGEKSNLNMAGEFIRKNDTAYLVMDYLEADDLITHMTNEKKVFSQKEAGDIIRQVATLLSDLHEVGLVHRRIGPDMIWITKDNQVRMRDIEATKQYILTQTRGLAGALKPGFAPAESYSKVEEQGVWTDVYALAATYYYLVTGKRPIESVKRTKEDKLPKLHQVVANFNEKVSDVIANAMSVMYWERPQSVNSFIDDLDKVEGVSVPTPFLRLKANGKTRQWKIEQDRDIHIGRSPEESEICIEGSSISRLHCTVHFDSRTNLFTVTDLSANGTFSARGLIGRGRSEEMEAGSIVYLVSNQYELRMEIH